MRHDHTKKLVRIYWLIDVQLFRYLVLVLGFYSSTRHSSSIPTIFFIKTERRQARLTIWSRGTLGRWAVRVCELGSTSWWDRGTGATQPLTLTLTLLLYLLFYFILFFAHFHFPASGQAVVTGVVSSPPRFLPPIFIAHT